MEPNIGNKPLVTIMMTTYNRSRYIANAIDSVKKQSYQDWKLLVLDDASSDDTPSVMRRYYSDPKITYLPSPFNLGISRNRNRGFALARGKYIAVLDSDDLWIDKSKLEKQVQFLEENNDHVIVGTDVAVIDSDEKETGVFSYEVNDAAIRKRLLLRNQFTHSSILLRTEALGGEKPYDETLSIWEDYDLILRLGQVGKLANLPEKMTAYRRHFSNISKAATHNGAKIHLSIIKKYRDDYPGYFLALLKGYLRLLFNLI